MSGKERQRAPLYRGPERKDPVRVLVLFVSLHRNPNDLPPGDDREGWNAIAWRRKYNTALDTWRMPVEALAHTVAQGRWLEQVILIPSANYIDRTGVQRDGTHAVADKLRKFLADLLARSNFGQTEVVLLHEIGPFAAPVGIPGRADGVDAAKGVPFNDPDALAAVIHRLYDWLRTSTKGYDAWQERDIVIDITGGQKETSVIAAMLSGQIAERRFQYVDTNTYEVRPSDLLYDVFRRNQPGEG